MIDDARKSPLHRRAFCSLLAFVAAVLVMAAAPFVEAVAYDVVCSAQGNKLVAHEGGGPVESHDHAAHCPLCMPVGAPPTAFIWDFTPVHPLAQVQQVIATERLLASTGAPLPARGPPPAS